jgi:ferritin-like metal-binding protein YciE
MMTTVKERTDEWLRDAHAAEAQAATMLRGTAGRNEDYPDFSRRLREQAELCDRHARTIDQCLSERGSSTSLIKDTTGQITALGQSLSGTILGDEVVKAALATSTFARMQTSSAHILAAAAGQEGDTATAQVCEDMANASERFAVDLDDLLPSLTVEYLSREAEGEYGEFDDRSTNAVQSDPMPATNATGQPTDPIS